MMFNSGEYHETYRSNSPSLTGGNYQRYLIQTFLIEIENKITAGGHYGPLTTQSRINVPPV